MITDTERLDWLLAFIMEHGTAGISKLPWTVYVEAGEDSDLRFDRAAIDLGMVRPPPSLRLQRHPSGWNAQLIQQWELPPAMRLKEGNR